MPTPMSRRISRLTLACLCYFLAAISENASVASDLPELKAQRWVNTTPLTPKALRGKIVLVDVWEYTCINWIRTSPYVKAWNRDYAKLGLVLIGSHAPEFEFGKRARKTSTAASATMASRVSNRDRQRLCDLEWPAQFGLARKISVRRARQVGETMARGGKLRRSRGYDQEAAGCGESRSIAASGNSGGHRVCENGHASILRHYR